MKKGEKNKRKAITKNNYKGRQVVFTKKEFMTQTMVLLGFRAGSLKSKQRPALSVLNTMLGQGKTSILNREIKIEKSLVSSISSDLELQEDTGYLGIYMQFDNSKAEELNKALLEIINRLKVGDFTKKDFEKAKNMIISSYEFAYESSLPFIDFQSFAHEEMLLDIEINPEDEIEKVKAVKFEEVAKVASEVLDLDNFVMSVVGKDEGVVEVI
jgi:predicted Zn-dependent peptidase